MDFITDKELDVYLVLILFMLKMKKSLPSKAKYSKREQRTDFTTI